jgi:hypothetical protein
VFVLENFFQEKQEEWNLLVKKARAYLILKKVAIESMFDELADCI